MSYFLDCFVGPSGLLAMTVEVKCTHENLWEKEMAKKAIVVLADGFEEIEAVTPVDILRRAGIEVTVCGLTGGVVTGAYGMKIAPDKSLDEFSGEADCIVLPGGMPGAENLAKSTKLRKLIKDMHRKNKIVAAICASPAAVLAPAGVLSGRKVTGYPGTEGGFGKDTVFVEADVAVDGNIITSRGPATALLFALAIAEKLAGKTAADDIRKRTLA